MFIARALLEEGHELLVLGLSAENQLRLAAGQPIDISRATHGLAVPAALRICIFAGETEDEMRRMMAPMIGPTTVVDQQQPQ
jgi:hypothetical protein